MSYLGNLLCDPTVYDCPDGSDTVDGVGCGCDQTGEATPLQGATITSTNNITGSTTASGSVTGTTGSAASSTSILSIFSGLSGLASSIGSAVSGTTVNTASLSATPTTAQPYPVVVNGKVVGYSSVETAATNTSSAFSITDIFLALLVLFGIWWVAFKKK